MAERCPHCGHPRPHEHPDAQPGDVADRGRMFAFWDSQLTERPRLLISKLGGSRNRMSDDGSSIMEGVGKYWWGKLLLSAVYLAFAGGFMWAVNVTPRPNFSWCIPIPFAVISIGYAAFGVRQLRRRKR